MSENRLDADDERIEQQKAIREQYRHANNFYEPKNCIKCYRPRVILRKNGKKICEKCFWDQDLNQLDSNAAQL